MLVRLRCVQLRCVYMYVCVCVCMCVCVWITEQIVPFNPCCHAGQTIQTFVQSLGHRIIVRKEGVCWNLCRLHCLCGLVVPLDMVAEYRRHFLSSQASPGEGGRHWNVGLSDPTAFLWMSYQDMLLLPPLRAEKYI